MVIRNKQQAKEVSNSFRNLREQVYQTPREEKRKPRQTPTTSRPVAKTYDEKRQLYEGEELFRAFNSPDMVYYFRDVAAKKGVKYVISSMEKDAACFKRLTKEYSNLIICLMIEFLFNSGQTYIKYPSPGVLASGWCNRIYKDAMDWSDGKFDPNSSSGESKPKQKRSLREWEGGEEEKVEIGEW